MWKKREGAREKPRRTCNFRYCRQFCVIGISLALAARVSRSQVAGWFCVCAFVYLCRSTTAPPRRSWKFVVRTLL